MQMFQLNSVKHISCDSGQICPVRSNKTKKPHESQNILATFEIFFQVNLFSSLVCIAIFRFCTIRVMEMQIVRDKRMNDGSRLSGTWHPLVAKVRTFLKNSTTSVLNELILDLQFFCECASHPQHSWPPGERKQVQPHATIESTVSDAIIERG